MNPKTVTELLADWDKGEIIHTIELGGLGPGYEQAIQIAAVEFSRACKDLEGMKPDDKASTEAFTKKCNDALHAIDKDLGGLSGAQFGASRWLAWKWCFGGGPAKLIEEAKKQGKEDQVMMVSRHFPKAPSV